MKNRKSLKLIILALTLALTIGAVIGISASANDDAELSVSITKKNIAVGDLVRVLFAVDNTNAGGKEVEILYYLEDPTENAEAQAYKGEVYSKGYTENEVTYPAFFTAAFPAKNIGDQVYAQAHIVDTDVYSEVVRTSVVEYLNKRLYVDTGVTDNQKGLYKSLLAYGAYAQKVLLNEDDDLTNNTDKFVDEMVYVSIEGGTLDGKYSTGVYSVGDTVTPYADGAVFWNITVIDAAGNVTYSSASNGSEYTVTGRSFFTLNTDAALTPYFDYYQGTSADGWDFDNDTFTTTAEMKTAHLLRRASWASSHLTAADDISGKSEYVRIVPYANGNNVFEFGANTGARDGIFFRRHSTDNTAYNARQFTFETKINLNISNTAAQAILDSGSNYVITMNISNISTDNPAADVRAEYVTGSEFARIYVAKDDEGKFHYYFNYATDTSAAMSALSELKDGWNIITTEMTYSQTGTCTATHYLNGYKVGESSFDGATDAALQATSAPNGVRLTYNSAVTGSYVYMDNIFCSYGYQEK